MRRLRAEVNEALGIARSFSVVDALRRHDAVDLPTVMLVLGLLADLATGFMRLVREAEHLHDDEFHAVSRAYLDLYSTVADAQARSLPHLRSAYARAFGRELQVLGVAVEMTVVAGQPTLALISPEDASSGWGPQLFDRNLRVPLQLLRFRRVEYRCKDGEARTTEIESPDDDRLAVFDMRDGAWRVISDPTARA